MRAVEGLSHDHVSILVVMMASTAQLTNTTLKVTCGPPRALSTTMLSTTTSLQAVVADPTTMAAQAAPGPFTTVARAAHDSAPARPSP